MKGKLEWLGGIFAVQLLIVAGLLLGGAFDGDDDASSLLSFEPGEIVKMTVSTMEDAVELTKGEQGWQVAGGLPADESKVGEILDKLANVSAPWPVATSGDSAERFEVTEDSFQRHVVLESADEPVADLLLGTSPGYRRVHARAAGADEVYSVDLSNYELPVEIDEWLDKTLLGATGSISNVRLELSWQLARDAEGWLIDGEAADQEEAASLVDRFADLRVLGVAEEVGVAKGAFAVTDDAGEYRLELFHDTEEDDYNVASDRVPGRYGIATYIAEQLLIDGAELLPEPEEEVVTQQPAEAETTTEAGGDA